MPWSYLRQCGLLSPQALASLSACSGLLPKWAIWSPKRREDATTVDVATSTSSLVHLSPTTNLDINLESPASPNSAHGICKPATILETSAASLPATNELPRDDTDSGSMIELSCTEVAYMYEKRDGTHGVAYCDSSSKYQWTPVVGTRKKKIPLPDYRVLPRNFERW